MKGISEIIATILMLMITLGISGTAYLFISGTFTQQTQGLELVDAFCIQDNSTHDNATVIVRNLGTVTVDTSVITVTQTSPSGPTNVAWNPTTIPPGTSATMVESCELGGSARTCIYRIIPPAGRSMIASISCT